MREIKFRAWYEKEEIMFNNVYILGDDILCALDELEPDGLDIIADINDVILEQYTGLKDKNGKEIFEGDIVEYNYEIKIKGIVKWIEDEALFSIHWESGKYGLFAGEDMSLYEVVGNIHDKEVSK